MILPPPFYSLVEFADNYIPGIPVGSLVYRGPKTEAYQILRDGVRIALWDARDGVLFEEQKISVQEEAVPLRFDHPFDFIEPFASRQWADETGKARSKKWESAKFEVLFKAASFPVARAFLRIRPLEKNHHRVSLQVQKIRPIIPHIVSR